MATNETRQDSITAEIHATRERLASQYRGDLAAYSKATELHSLNLGFHFSESPRHSSAEQNYKNTERATLPILSLSKARS